MLMSLSDYSNKSSMSFLRNDSDIDLVILDNINRDKLNLLGTGTSIRNHFDKNPELLNLMKKTISNFKIANNYKNNDKSTGNSCNKNLISEKLNQRNINLDRNKYLLQKHVKNQVLNLNKDINIFKPDKKINSNDFELDKNKYKDKIYNISTSLFVNKTLKDQKNNCQDKTNDNNYKNTLIEIEDNQLGEKILFNNSDNKNENENENENINWIKFNNIFTDEKIVNNLTTNVKIHKNKNHDLVLKDNSLKLSKIINKDRKKSVTCSGGCVIF
jgi:hypothetical protein